MRNDEVFRRLQSLINYCPMQMEISKKTGINQNTLSAKKIRNSRWTAEEIEKLNQAYNIDIYKESSFNQNEDCILIPVRGNLSASMGFGIEIIDESQTGTYPTPKKLARALGLNPEMADYILAEGDSIAPTIDGGSMVLVDHTRTEVIDGKIFCIRLNNKLMAKRLQYIPPKSVSVVSDNPKYKSFDIDLSKELDFDFAIIGEVRWWGTLAR